MEGIGFAIPIEVAVEKAEQIINGDNSLYPYLGISTLNVEDIKNNYNYRQFINDANVTTGVVIIDIENESPVANKLKSGDVITEVNGEKMKNVAYLRYELYKYKIGDTIKVKIVRDNQEKEVSITLN